MPTYRHSTHRLLKSRARKRRVSSHQYHPNHQENPNRDYFLLRSHQLALSKIRRQPELLQQVWQNLKQKQQNDPEQPQLAQWHQLLEGCSDIEVLAEQVLGCGSDANELRQYSAMDFLFDEAYIRYKP